MLAGCSRCGRDVSRWQGRDKCQPQREPLCQLTTGGETYTDGQVVGASCRGGERQTRASHVSRPALGVEWSKSFQILHFRRQNRPETAERSGQFVS